MELLKTFMMLRCGNGVRLRADEPRVIVETESGRRFRPSVYRGEISRQRDDDANSS